MTACTIGTATPVPAGPGTAAHNPKSDDAGWAMVPHAIAADVRLSAVDIRVVLALLYFARSKTTCTPCDNSIAARAGQINAATVQRSLRRLQQLGYIEREQVAPSDRNRTGRVIHLLFKNSPFPAVKSTRSTAAGNGCEYQGPRSATTPAPAMGDTGIRTRPPSQPCATPPAPVRDKGIVVVEGENQKIDPDSTLRSRPDQSTQAPTTAAPAVQSPEVAAPLPFDLTAIGAMPQPPAAPSLRQRSGLGLTLEELAKVARDDPILAAELARKCQPPPHEPSPAAVPTAELFELLPGRHDLIMAAARRLCEETGDYNVATQRTFEQMATAVATRAVPSEVLISCWRQAMGPRAEHRGKVLVAAWQREARDYVTPMRR